LGTPGAQNRGGEHREGEKRYALDVKDGGEICPKRLAGKSLREAGIPKGTVPTAKICEVSLPVERKGGVGTGGPPGGPEYPRMFVGYSMTCHATYESGCREGRGGRGPSPEAKLGEGGGYPRKRKPRGFTPLGYYRPFKKMGPA